MTAKRMLAHCKVDARKDGLLTLSGNAEGMFLPGSHIIFYEFDSNFELLQKKEFNVSDHLIVHDWAFTDTHYLLFGNGIKVDIAGSISAVCGVSPMISAFSLDPSKSTSPVYLLPRSQNESQNDRDWRSAIEVPAQLWLSHFSSGFETVDDEEGTMEVQFQASACSYEWFDVHKFFGGYEGYDGQGGRLDPSLMNVKQEEKALLPHLVQVSIEINAQGDCQKCSVDSLNDWTQPSDFPVINPRFSRRKNDTWSPGEPIFVPKVAEEDDGYILVVEYAVSVQRCYLVILNPKRTGEADALLARREVPEELSFPFGFHGFWDVGS